MNTALRIDVRVAAKEALAALKAIEGAIVSVTRSRVGRTSMSSGFVTATRDADAFNKRLELIKRNLANWPKILEKTQPRMPASPWTDESKFKSHAAIRKQVWAQQVAAAKAAKQAEVQATKAAAAEALALEKRQALIRKQVWAQQVAAAKAAKQAEVQATKAAAAEALAFEKRQALFRKQVWAQQVAAAKATKQAELQAARQAHAEQVALEKRQALIRKQVWAQQVAAAKAAKQAELQAARQAHAEQVALEKRQALIRKQVWAQQVAAAKAAAAAEAAAQRAAALPQATMLGRANKYLTGAMDRERLGLIQRGKDMQWVGRQINFNFTLPLAAAATMSTKWALESEAAFVRVRKVYGDGSRDYTQELNKIKQSMTALSSIYGVNRAEVNELASAWAAAGAEGGALAQLVKTSLDLSILGDYANAADTFNALVTIMGSYKIQVGELATVIAKLNTVENMTAATLPDLVDGISRAGGVAKMAGVSIDHLAAMMAVLVPATGSATTAGNALRTIMSRLLQPTNQAGEILKELGFDIDSVSWNSMSAAQRLEELSRKWQTLNDAQRGYASSILSSRYQLNRFAVLMDDVNNTMGTYQRVLREIQGTEGAEKAMRAANLEVQTLLQSDPRRLQIMANMFKNFAADAVLPLLPALIQLMKTIVGIFEWMGNLSPTVHKLGAAFLLAAVSAGVLAQIIGSFKLLFGTIGQALVWVLTHIVGMATSTVAATATIGAASTTTTGTIAANAVAQTGIVAGAATKQAGIVSRLLAFLASIGGSVAAAVASPAFLVGAAIVGVVALLVIFRKQIWDFLQAVHQGFIDFGNMIGDRLAAGVRVAITAFTALPRAIAGAMMAVVRIVAAAVKTVWKWLSYLNPFQRHSPSLVDNVKAGMAVIAQEYAKMASIGSLFERVARNIRSFAAATAAARSAGRASARNEERIAVRSVAPQAMPQLEALYVDYDELQRELDAVSEAIRRQEAIVDPLKRAYEEAQRAVDAFERALTPLRITVRNLEEDLQASRDRMRDLADTPIEGMKAMNDQIWENEMAQKRLRLAIMDLEDASGSYDKIRDKISAINGEMEMLSGEREGLRQGGAGSEILSLYDEQMKKLQDQRKSYENNASEIEKLREELDKLQRTGEQLDLRKALQFEPLTKEIRDLADAQKELPFDEIIDGIRREKKIIDELTPSYEEQRKALDGQEEQLRRLQDERDLLKARYEDEQAILDALKESYSEIEDRMKQVAEAIREVVDLYKAAGAAAGGAGGVGGGGVGGGGVGGGLADMIGDIEDLEAQLEDLGEIDLEKLLEDWQKQLDKFTFDPWGWIKDRFKDFKEWMSDQVMKFSDWLSGTAAVDVARAVRDWVRGIWQGLSNYGRDLGGQLSDMKRQFLSFVDWLWTFPSQTVAAMVAIYKTLKTKAEDAGRGLWEGFTTGIQATVEFFVALPKNVRTWVGNASSWLLEKGRDVVQGLWNGLNERVPQVAQWLLDLPGRVFAWLGNCSHILVSRGVEFVAGILTGLVNKTVDVVKWLAALPGRIKAWLGDLSQTLLEQGKQTVGGLLSGLMNKVVDVTSWVTALPADLVAWLGDLGKKWFDDGKALVQGLMDGILEKARGLRDFIKRNVTDKLPLIGPVSRIIGSIPGLSEGGVIRKGGLARLHDWEAVIPLRNERRALEVLQQAGIYSDFALPAPQTGGSAPGADAGAGGGNQYIFNNATFAFPNITKPQDAEKFLRNLETLAG